MDETEDDAIFEDDDDGADIKGIHPNIPVEGNYFKGLLENLDNDLNSEC